MASVKIQYGEGLYLDVLFHYMCKTCFEEFSEEWDFVDY
jgi:hypothetical protein